MLHEFTMPVRCINVLTTTTKSSQSASLPRPPASCVAGTPFLRQERALVKSSSCLPISAGPAISLGQSAPSSATSAGRQPFFTWPRALSSFGKRVSFRIDKRSQKGPQSSLSGALLVAVRVHRTRWLAQADQCENHRQSISPGFHLSFGNNNRPPGVARQQKWAGCLLSEGLNKADNKSKANNNNKEWNR